MPKKGTSLWDDISIIHLKKCYLMILDKYQELENEEWLKYLIIKEKCNRTWWLKIDSRIKHNGILPSLLFIWYAYKYLNSNKTSTISIVKEILENTPEGKKKRLTRNRKYLETRRKNETPVQRGLRLHKQRENERKRRTKLRNDLQVKLKLNFNKPMNLRLLSDSELVENKKDLDSNYSRTIARLESEPNNLMIKQAVYNFEIELDDFKEEIIKRRLTKVQ